MNNTLEKVARLPIDFHTVGIESLIQLLKDCGYTANPDSITESDLERCLCDLSDWCNAWIGYSQNRRANCGWVISDNTGHFVVHYYPSGKETLASQLLAPTGTSPTEASARGRFGSAAVMG